MVDAGVIIIHVQTSQFRGEHMAYSGPHHLIWSVAFWRLEWVGGSGPYDKWTGTRPCGREKIL